MNWTSVEELKPPAGVPLLVTVESKFGLEEGKKRIVIYPIYLMMSSKTGDYGYYLATRGKKHIELLEPELFRVVAWMRWPLPFEGDNDER